MLRLNRLYSSSESNDACQVLARKSREVDRHAWPHQKEPISIETANKVYKTFIWPIIDYCDTVWNCCGAISSNKIEKLQRRAARLVMKSNSSDKTLDYLKYENLSDRREKHVLTVVKNILKNKCPQFFVNYFKFNKDCINRFTRQSNQIRLPKIKLESTNKAFYYHGGVLFNQYL